MQQKKIYRIKNWSQYNKALIQRGSISIWIEEDALKNWVSYSCTGKAGRPEIYSKDAILMLLVLRERFGLALRALQGFASSVFAQMGLNLPVPSYTQISRRAKTLHKHIKQFKSHGVKHIIFDSTGLKVYGEGEWKVRVHGKGKRWTWRKFHIAIDAETQDIVACELTENGKGDAETAVKMLRTLPKKIKTVRGDGAYDSGKLRKEVYKRGGRTIVPPPRKARYKGAKEGWKRERDAVLAEIEGLGGGEEGRKMWKILSEYHKRSRVETSMFRVKKAMGGGLKARNFDSQKTEAICKCLVINKMNKSGLPRGRWV